MQRSGYTESYVMSPESCTLYGMVQGAGAAAPVIPTMVFSGTSSKGYMSAANNFVSSVAGDITRSGVGVYTMKLKDGLPVVFDISPNVWGPTGTWSTVSDYNPSTRVISILVWAPGGAAADLAATEFLHLTITGQLSVFP
jgi:hypothetical protein